MGRGRYELYVIRFQQRHGLDNPETTQPTCCPRYPPGSTLLECRFEGDQPVANVVQVPGCANNHPKTCFLLETQASRSGPSSRYETIYAIFFFSILKNNFTHFLSSSSFCSRIGELFDRFSMELIVGRVRSKIVDQSLARRIYVTSRYLY